MQLRQVFTRESADTRRDALIAATARCLSTRGAHGTSVRAICVEAGVSAGLLRHYFDGIDALVAATYRATGARVAAALHAAVDAVLLRTWQAGAYELQLIAAQSAFAEPQIAHRAERLA